MHTLDQIVKEIRLRFSAGFFAAAMVKISGVEVDVRLDFMRFCSDWRRSNA
jgi:hypothetical protein